MEAIWKHCVALVGVVLTTSCEHSYNRSLGDEACDVTGKAFHYVDAAGTVITILDEDDGYTVSGPGVHSADVDHLFFHATRSGVDVFVRNYGAINARLLQGKEWTGNGLDCRASRDQTTSSSEVSCVNIFGDINGYHYRPGVGVDEIFTIINGHKFAAKLSGPEGLFLNCAF